MFGTFDEVHRGSVMLEPRIQEYIRSKKFNKKNNIVPGITEENEFNIDKDDIKLIKRYLKGGKNLYNDTQNLKNFVEPIRDVNTFNNDFKNDPRYDRIVKKMEKHKQAQNSIRQENNMNKEYSTFSSTNPYDLDNNKNYTNQPFTMGNMVNSNNLSNNNVMLDSRDLSLDNYKPKNNNRSMVYEQPKIKGNTLEHNRVGGHIQHNHSTIDIIGKLDKANDGINNTYEYSDQYTDVDSNTFIPAIRNSTQREKYNDHRNIPFMYGNGMIDVDIESSMRGNITDTSKKSFGFKNPFENQFNYIDSRIQNQKHVVNDRPVSTRGINKEIARPISRSTNVYY